MRAGWEDGRYISFGLDLECVHIRPKIFDGDGRFDVYQTLIHFAYPIIDKTHDLVNVVYKINPSFYQSCGSAGIEALSSIIRYIHQYDVPVIYDGKFGEIEHTATYQADTSYSLFGADAVTVSPLVDLNSIPIYDEYREISKGCFVICYPSTDNYLARKVYKDIARDLGQQEGIGLVVGANNIKILRHVRNLAGDDTAFLIPGLGAQGGVLALVIEASGKNILLHYSRYFLQDAYAAPIGHDFASDIRCKLEVLNETIVSLLKQ